MQTLVDPEIPQVASVPFGMTWMAGPRVYAGEVVREPMINGAGRDTATISDVEAGVAIFNSACSVLALAAFAGFLCLL